MTSSLSRWPALGAWAAIIAGLWLVLVPAVLSFSSLALLSLAGPVLVIAASTLRGLHVPAPSPRRAQVEAEAAEGGGRK